MIMTKEIVESEISSLRIMVKVMDSNIDSYLETLSMFMKADCFNQTDIDWVNGLLEVAQSQKEKFLADIEVKKSVMTFL